MGNKVLREVLVGAAAGVLGSAVFAALAGVGAWLLALYATKLPSWSAWLTEDLSIPRWWVFVGAAWLTIGLMLCLQLYKVRLSTPVATKKLRAEFKRGAPSPRAFSDREIGIIRLLRAADDVWLSPDTVAEFSDVQPKSVAETDRCMRKLHAEGWLELSDDPLYGPTFQLAGPGLDFAVERRFDLASPDLKDDFRQWARNKLW